MEFIKKNQTLENSDAFLEYNFETLDLNKDLEKIYEIINDDDSYNEFQKEIKLSDLRNENHKRFYYIDISKFKILPSEFYDTVDDILELYNTINSNEILSYNWIDSNNTKTLLDNIYRRIEILDRQIISYLKEKTKYNDNRQAKFSLNYFNNLEIDEKTKKNLIEKYNDLVLYSSYLKKDSYEELIRQIKREEYINEILKLLNIEEENKITKKNQDKLILINKNIDKEISKYKEQIQYLEDIIPQNSKHIEEFENFKSFCNKLFAYDDTNYNNAKQTFEILSDESRFKNYVSNFEELFVQEIIDKQKEETFIFEKVGIKNLKNSLNFITVNYMDKLDEENKNIIEYIFEKLNNEHYDLNDLNQALRLVVRNIWKATITDVYNFNPNEDFYFICSNNQFIDEKYQTILLTKKELEMIDDYEDYQIGFICNYNDNIIYITENEDIMDVEYDDMSNLKTPIQIEQEFTNFKVCNRIALDGFKTKIEAIYYINDGNIDKYMKALELANMYKLPLIELKKDK